MTGLAFGRPVGTDQVETSAGMVEPTLNGTAVHSIPSRYGVAGSASFGHPAIMGILVAGHAVRRVHRFVSNHRIFLSHLFCNVAPLTRRITVETLQRIGSTPMVESRSAAPFLLGVAGPTILPYELAPVGVVRFVARGALPWQTQISPLQTSFGGKLLQDRRVSNPLRSVAIPALGL